MDNSSGGVKSRPLQHRKRDWSSPVILQSQRKFSLQNNVLFAVGRNCSSFHWSMKTSALGQVVLSRGFSIRAAVQGKRGECPPSCHGSYPDPFIHLTMAITRKEKRTRATYMFSTKCHLAQTVAGPLLGHIQLLISHTS